MKLNYNIYFEVASVFFLISLTLYLQLQYNMNTKRNREFQKLTFLVLVAVVLDIVTAITNSNGDVVPYRFNMFANTLYFFSVGLLGIQFFYYAIQLKCDIKYINVLEGFVWSVFSGFVILLIANLACGCVFDFVDGVYVHNTLYYAVYVAPFLLFALSAVMMIFISRSYDTGQKIAVYLYIVVSVSGLVIQAFIFPEVLLGLFTIAVGINIILFFLESEEYRELNDVLYKMKSMNYTANEVIDTKNRFLNNIGQNIAMPLKEIIECDEQLKEMSDNPEMKKNIEQIARLAVNILGKMDDIIEYTDLELDRMVFEEKQYNVNNMLDACLMTIEKQAEEKHIIIERCYKRGPACLKGDREIITRALRKILVNAIEYMDDGAITIRTQYRELSKDTMLLTISVEDTGDGINEKYQEQIFDIFEKRNDNSTGMGIGLSYVKRVVELMGGSVGMYSTEGVGSLFYMEVPQKKVLES